MIHRLISQAFFAFTFKNICGGGGAMCYPWICRQIPTFHIGRYFRNIERAIKEDMFDIGGT